MKTRPAVLTLSLSLLAILLAANASASLGAGGQPPTPQEAARERARFDARPSTPVIVADRRVSAAEATSGAIGPSYGTVELATAGGAPSTYSEEGSVTGQCRYVEYRHDRGIVPFERAHHAGTYWCYVYNNRITYRRTNTWGRATGLCSTTDARNWKIGGGAGYRWVKVHSEAWFSCPTPWWYTLNDSLWMQIAYNVFGNSAVEGSNT
jgi:hypothetical protein